MDDLQTYFTADTLSVAADYLLSVVAFIVILVVGRYLARWIRELIRGGLDKPGVDRTLTKFASNFAYYGIFLLALFAGLETVGVETASFIAVLAAASFAVGLALQGTLANFAAGIMLLIFRPYSVGDRIEVAGVDGNVDEISLFFTHLDTPDNRRMIIPNGEVFGKTIQNDSFHETRRCDVAVGVGYDDDIDQAREVLLEAAKGVEGGLEEPEPAVVLTGLGGSSVDFSVRVHCNTEDYWDVKDRLTRACKLACDENGLDIPYPHQVNVQKEA